MLITSTCFASDIEYPPYPTVSNATDIEYVLYEQKMLGTSHRTYLKAFYTTKNELDLSMTLSGSDITVIDNNKENTENYSVFWYLTTDSNGYTWVSGGSASSWLDSQNASVGTLHNNTVYRSTVNIYNEDNSLFLGATGPIVPEEEEPEIGGDIMGGNTTLTFPDTGYQYWEGVIHLKDDITYAVMLVSNDPFIADNFLYREGSGDTQDIIRFSASAEDTDTNYLVRVYVLQPDNTWLFSSGSSYTGTSMAHNFNVGNVVMTTKNIENEDGTIFFPLTPVETLEGLGAKIMETMAKIAMIAVSCLVLLISLQVLLKVLRIYLA